MKPGVLLLLLVVALAGCSARQTFPVQPQGLDDKSLEAYIARVRALSAQARPTDGSAQHVEAADPRLAAALIGAAAVPSPGALRLVAAEYRRLGIVDKAHEALQQALRLDDRDAATYDALARLWRDGGAPALALGDAHRAVHHAPGSPVARNTLGTVLQALGRHRDARIEYERAVRLDPTAAYAHNNLCYAWILEGDLRRAQSACRTALEYDPALNAARNNLGLVHAIGGELGAAQAAFEASGDRAASLYNLGIVHLAHRRYADAVTAFAEAQRVRPAWRLAAVRARQAAVLAFGADAE